jgi:hypothetical protein
LLPAPGVHADLAALSTLAALCRRACNAELRLLVAAFSCSGAV